MTATIFPVLMLATIFLWMPAASVAGPLGATAFAYDSAAPIHVREISLRHQADVTIREISFPSPKGGTIHAEFVSPGKIRGPHGATLFVHWLGDPGTTNLTEFQRDAAALARRGCVSMLIDAMWAQPHWYTKVRSPETDYVDSINQVIDLRRSLDLLARQPGVDSHRIAYVGHDFGAMYGAVMSGVDARPRWYVLMAGNPSFSEWYLLFPKLHPPKDKPAYLAQMAQLDPPLYLARTRAEEFLFQFANKDFYIPRTRAAAFANAATKPHRTLIYKSDHSLNVPAAFADRMAWLEKRLTESGPIAARN